MVDKKIFDAAFISTEAGYLATMIDHVANVLGDISVEEKYAQAELNRLAVVLQLTLDRANAFSDSIEANYKWLVAALDTQTRAAVTGTGKSGAQNFNVSDENVEPVTAADLGLTGRKAGPC